MRDNRPLILLLILVIVLISLINIVTADNTTKKLSRREELRQNEIAAANTIAMILFLVILVPVILYFATEHAVKVKHMSRAKKVAKKAKHIVVEHLDKEKEHIKVPHKEDSDNKSKKEYKSKSDLSKLKQKAQLQRKLLQNKVVLNRHKNQHIDKNILMSEFVEDGDENFLKPKIKENNKTNNLKNKNKSKSQVFVSLNELSTDFPDKETLPNKPKRKKFKKKINKDLFDNLEDLKK